MIQLTTTNLTKCYDNHVKALDGFSFTFTEGIYGLLGPNGAGKSTLMNLLTDNLSPTEGEILYNGENIQTMGKEYRKVLGYMPQQQGLYSGFTLERFLYYMAVLKGIEKEVAKEQIPKLIQLVNLQDSCQQKLGGFSGDMKQRALIAQACSLQNLANVPQTVSILQYLIFVAIFRYMGLAFMMLGLFYVSSKTKSVIGTCITGVLLVVLPLVFVYLQVPGAVYLLLNPFLIGNVF